MKMTTEQFLSQLGIEVGKPFNAKGKMLNGKYIIVYFEETEGCIEHYSVFDFDMNDYEDGYGYSLEVLLDCEITPLPKYTLTEDEKAIVRHAPKEADDILNQLGGVNGLAFITKDSSVIDLPLVDLFTFIKRGEYVSLDELRKCL